MAVIGGPLQGEVIPLTDGRLSVGRDPDNTLTLADARVSRFHCELEARSSEILVRDLGSTNGTFVNGRPIREATLVEGDQVSVGRTVMALLDAERESDPALLRIEDDPAAWASTVVLEPGQPFRQDAAEPLSTDDRRVRHDLEALLRINQAINSISEVAPLMERLLELVFEVVPAETGAILLGASAEALEETHARPPDAPITLSRTVMKRVFAEGTALLSSDVGQDGAVPETKSLARAGAKSVLCIPLQLYGRILGLLYLQTGNALAPFDARHLHLATAAATSAAVALENARNVEWLKSENSRLRDDLGIKHDLVGQSESMKRVLEFISRVAPTDSTVLITGENGTGKELAACAIHCNGPRSQGPFVAINCATLSESLLESELFGHEKGAFTGAVARKKGKIEMADKGTLLLDEAAELAPELQAKLLRVLQEQEFERVGGTSPIKVDVRVIAATNRDLKQAIADGEFRQDLYYRLNVVSVEMPPLRDRRDDIGLLTQHFLRKCSAKCKRSVDGISSRARACLLAHNWPGNVRELENAIERALVLGTAAKILAEDLPEEIVDQRPAVNEVSTYHESLRQKKRQLLRQAVLEAGGNYTQAAQALGLHPNYLHRLLTNLELRDELRREFETRSGH